MTDELVILVPVLRRPNRVAPLLESIRDATPDPYRVVFIVDADDHAERDAVARAGGEELVCDGTYPTKINYAVRATTEPLVFLGADDLHFHPGWLKAATRFLTNTVGVVGTNDLGNRRVIAGEHATHSLVARWYIGLGTIDHRHTLLHEGYRHCFCDDELIGTAKRRGAWAFARDSHVEHLHPDWGKTPRDEVYDLGQLSFRHDRRTYRNRAHLWT